MECEQFFSVVCVGVDDLKTMCVNKLTKKCVVVFHIDSFDHLSAD
jgi:hypothetical protein